MGDAAPRIDVQAMVRDHAAAIDCTLPDLFKRADVAYSNWFRWVNGETTPTVGVLEKLLAVKRRRG